MYEVTKRFTSGLMKGVTITVKTDVMLETGRIYKACAGSDYEVIEVLTVFEVDSEFGLLEI